jgi:endonuclease/exonuclease/phosphatase family metal-dependent hydrolase
MKKMLAAPAETIVRDSLLAFVFFSLITGFIEATYTFGLLGTDIPPEIVYILFLFSPFLLLLVPRSLDSRIFSTVAAGLAIAAWAISLPLATRWRMLAMGVGCGFFLIYLTCAIRQSSGSASGRGAALGLGALLSMLVRSLSSGNLLLTAGWRLAAGVVLAALALVLLIWTRESPEPARPDAEKIGFGRTLGLSIGLFSVLILIYFGFTSPTVIARWGSVNYTVVTAIEAGALALFIGFWLGMPRFRARLSPALLFGWNALFIVALGIALLLRQPPFSAATVYPLYQADPAVLARFSFWAMLVLHPVLYADFAFLAGALYSGRPSPRGLAAGFGLGGALILILSFGQIFTTVYDYIPVVGPPLRDKFWLVMVIPAVLAGLSLFLVKRPLRAATATEKSAVRFGWLAAVVALAGASVLIAGVTTAQPAAATPTASIHVMTYNIQQGYGKDGEKNFIKQREVIAGLAPDIIGIEESDSARIAGGNSDIVRYFADGLGLYAYYGPSPISGTFGVALLSRFPIRNARTFFMPSRGEQTACIEADVAVGDALVHVLVTHLDNDGALPQQRLVIERAIAGATGRVVTIAMGDFNFDPKSEQYRQTTAALDDSWVVAKERVVDPGASDPAVSIDHIFVSRNARVLRARYVPEGPSDHPGMLAELSW